MGQVNKEKKAFHIIFKSLLGVKDKDHVSVIYDESFLPLFDSFSAVVNELRLAVTYIFIPISYQGMIQTSQRFQLDSGEISLPTGISTSISNSEIVINFLNGDISSSKVRGAVLNQRRIRTSKVAHCPGMSVEILNLIIRSPIKKISRLSELMAWALGNAGMAMLVTTDRQGKEYGLKMKLDGWDNEPLMSPGIICEGSWGNLPPGETFCCPKHVNVQGKICINGSVPGFVLQPEDEAVLVFEKGKLINWECKPGSQSDLFFNRIKSEAHKKNDNNWNTFAELGIGLNPMIKTLTGNSLFDEKMAGTIHVALGDNISFGHTIKSHIHADMVVLNPTLLLDNRIIIDKGSLNMSVITQWKKSIKYNDLVIDDVDTIRFITAAYKITGDSMMRQVNKGDRLGYINMFPRKYKHLIAKMKNILEDKDEIQFISLLDSLGLKFKKHLKEALNILHHYRVIEKFDADPINRK